MIGAGILTPLRCALTPLRSMPVSDVMPLTSVSGNGVAAVGCEASELLALIAGRAGSDSRLGLVVSGALEAACLGLAAEKISVEATCARGQVTPLYVGLLRAIASLVGVQAKVRLVMGGGEACYGA